MDIQLCKYMVLFYFIFDPGKLKFESEHFNYPSGRIANEYLSIMQVCTFFLILGKSQNQIWYESIIFEIFSFEFEIFYIMT